MYMSCMHIHVHAYTCMCSVVLSGAIPTSLNIDQILILSSPSMAAYFIEECLSLLQCHGFPSP